jgi:hypothetical protein
VLEGDGALVLRRLLDHLLSRRGLNRQEGYLLRSSRQWISWVVGWRHSRIRYSNPGSSTIGIESGDAGHRPDHDLRVG